MKSGSTIQLRNKGSMSHRLITTDSTDQHHPKPLTSRDCRTDRSGSIGAIELSVSRNPQMKTSASTKPSKPKTSRMAKTERSVSQDNFQLKAEISKQIDKLLQAKSRVQGVHGTTGNRRHRCVLDGDNVPPIPEMDHLNRRCLCYLCTCDVHVCPGNRMFGRLSATSAFKSIYKKDYKRKQAANHSETSCSLKLLRSNSAPMDLKTTNREDFQPYKFEQKEPAKFDILQPSLRFMGRSLYNSEYPNWGPAFVGYEKHYHLPYRGKDLRLDVRTTYGSEFVGNKDTKQELFIPGAKPINMLSTGPISASTQFIGESVSNSSYGIARKQGQTFSYAVKQGYNPSEYASSHFTTTYTNEFTSKSPSKLWPKRQV